MNARAVVLAIAVTPIGACADPQDAGGGETGSTSSGGTTQTDGPVDPGDLEWPLLVCDPLAPSYCAFPFPSNVYTQPDEGTRTGRRVVMPPESNGDLDNEPWGTLDGFSPSSAIMVHLPGAVSDGLPGPQDIAFSLDARSPTILLDTQTGERVAHFAELDASVPESPNRTLLIRPSRRLEGGRRYIVALRGIAGATGELLPPSPTFAALRDGTDLPEEPSVASRRALYDDIFFRLGAAGLRVEDLQLAWDFTTASDEVLTGWLLHMRDDSFAGLGGDAPAFSIDVLDDAWRPEEFLYRVEGTVDVPLYLDSATPGMGRLRLDAQGMPTAQSTLSVPFELIVPRSALDEPAAIVQHGHGLFGDSSQIEADTLRDLAVAGNYAIFGVDWMGMSGDDSVHIALAISTGDTDGVVTMTDRLHQGALNHLFAMRALITGVAADPALEGLLDVESRYYYGISQGGILGGVYMGITTDVERGVLDVMGQPYNLLLSRSADFDFFFMVFRGRWPDPRDVQYVLGATQMLWDRVEPSGYTKFIRDPLPGTPPHEVLLTAAVGDHQVPTLGAHVMARSIPGLRHLETGVRPVWGLEVADDRHEGTAYVEYSFGLPEDPPCNVPQTACNDPHGRLRNLESAQHQIDHFLRTGEVANFCPDGRCNFPQLSGCEPGEQTPDVCPP